MSKNIRLHIPGPVEVSDDTYKAMSKNMIGHRSKDFSSLYERIHPMLQNLFGTNQPIFLSTSSAWGVMEGSIRNLVEKKVLCCCSGAFSDKWLDVSKRCGKDAEALVYEWGQPVNPNDIDEKLSTGEFDAVTFIHNETSTGVTNPLEDISNVVNKYEEVSLIVDTVSSFSVVPIEVDNLKVDVLLTGSQKALALPPGLSLFTVSDKALSKCQRLSDRGYYFDFIEFSKNQEKFMTPSTPCISLIYGLEHQLNKFFSEGIENRFKRHEKLNNMVHDWVNNNGFEFFAPENFRSKGLTCIVNNKNIDLPKLIHLMREDHFIQMDGGYGKLKGKAFRLSNMGDETEDSIGNLLSSLDKSISKL